MLIFLVHSHVKLKMLTCVLCIALLHKKIRILIKKKKKQKTLKNIKDIELFLSANLNTTPYLSLKLVVALEIAYLSLPMFLKMILFSGRKVLMCL